MVEPDRHLGVVAAGRYRVAVKAPHLLRQNLAIGQFAGEQLVQAHSQGEQVTLLVGRLLRALRRHGAKAPLLGIDVIGRAGMQQALRFGLPPAQGHTQIEQAQNAVFALVQVGWFDISVNHALAVQLAQRASGLGGHGQGLLQVEFMAPIELLLQGFSAMPVIQQVKGAALPAAGQRLVHRHQMVTGTARLHAFGQPGLVRQHGALLHVVGARRVEGFQRIQASGFGLAHLVQHVDAVVGHGGGHSQAVDPVAHAQARWNRQHLRVAPGIGKGSAQQALDVHHHRSHVVATAGGQRRSQQVLARLLRCDAASQFCQVSNLALTQRAMHAVAEQHKHIADLQLALHVVDHDVVFGAD